MKELQTLKICVWNHRNRPKWKLFILW